MKSLFIRLSLIELLLAMLGTSEVKAQLELEAEIRPRAELRRGFSSLPDSSGKAASFVSQRSRLGLHYKKEQFAFKISVQDVRIWGSEEQARIVPSIALYEAWAEVSFLKNSQLRFGRQELVYDDHRILGNAEWLQQGRTHDALVWKFIKNGWKTDLGGAYNQEAEKLSGNSYSLNNYKYLAFLWANKTFCENLRLSILGVSDGFQIKDSTQDVIFRHTYGLDFSYRLKAFDFKGAFFGQSGTDIRRNTISAGMASLQLGYTIQKFRFCIGGDYLSGTDQVRKEAGRNHSFNTLYSTNHKFYGYMDYFLNIPADTRNGGLKDFYFRTKYTANSKLTLTLDYHYFALASALPSAADATVPVNFYLGSELDAVLNFKPASDMSVFVGYSAMFPGESMSVIKAGDNRTYAHWAWAMITINPKILLKE